MEPTAEASLEAPVCRSARRPKGQRPKGDALKCRQGHDPNTGSKRRVMDRPGLSFLEESRVVLDNEEESEQSLCDEEGDSIRNSYLKQQQWLELTTVLLAIVVSTIEMTISSYFHAQQLLALKKS
ncbi:hypothetical protein C0Q70_10774 [Pomacea canaliculata]|uniref:Uncharacterized protein n=1 Tax=Pomacea canaliculata TaxID=400727 RepID=A0A2T7P451_POMCA|nr:hypothetical protein C0Q70_10774 [Pomacea canaliculata]